MGFLIKTTFLVISLFSQVVPVASIKIKQLWPLDSQTCESEVLLDTFQYKAVCNHRKFSAQPTGFPFRSMVFTGEEYVDVRVGFTTASIEHYSVQGFFYLTEPNGVLFHYKADELYKEAILWFENGNFSLYRRVSSTKSETYTQNVPISLNAWYYISFGVGAVGFVWANLNETRHLLGTIANRNSIEVPSNLRIGGEFNGTKPNFKGLVTCVGFILGKRDGLISELLENCKTTPWMGNAQQSNSLYYSYTNDEGLFLQPVYSAQMRSLTQCAYSCLRDSRCFYVYYNENTYGCTMYTRVEKEGAIRNSLTLYHKVKP